MLTDSMLFSPALSCTISCSTSFMAPFLLLLHTILKWSFLLHSIHNFPYTGYCPGGWLLLQYWHVCFVGIFVITFLLGMSLWAFSDTDFVKLPCFSNTAYGCRLCSLCLNSFFPDQYVFTHDGTIFFYFCEFPNDLP